MRKWYFTSVLHYFDLIAIKKKLISRRGRKAHILIVNKSSQEFNNSKEFQASTNKHDQKPTLQFFFTNINIYLFGEILLFGPMLQETI